MHRICGALVQRRPMTTHRRTVCTNSICTLHRALRAPHCIFISGAMNMYGMVFRGGWGVELSQCQFAQIHTRVCVISQCVWLCVYVCVICARRPNVGRDSFARVARRTHTSLASFPSCDRFRDSTDAAASMGNYTDTTTRTYLKNI